MKHLYTLFVALILVGPVQAQSNRAEMVRDLNGFLNKNQTSDIASRIQIDRLQQANVQLKDSLTNAKWTAAAATKNIRLISLMGDAGKNDLKSLKNKYPELLDSVQGGQYALKLTPQVNFETVQSLTRSDTLARQFPAFFNLVQSNHLLTVDFGAEAVGAGMQVPAIPTLAVAQSSDDDYHQLANNYNTWIVTYITINHCSMEYTGIFAQKEQQVLPANAGWKARAEFRRRMMAFLATKCPQP